MIAEAVKIRVLVVEDDKRMLGALCDLLTDLGYDPEPAANGTEALSRFQPGTFGLVVTDYKMPGLTGLDVAKLLRARDPAVDVLIVTGYAMDFEGEARALGVRVLPKPVDLRSFAQLVADIAAANPRGPESTP